MPGTGAPASRRTFARQDRAVGVLFVAVLLAWIAVARTMGGMDGGPGTPLGPFPAFLASWVLMLAAMMLPAELRFTLVFARLDRDDAPGAGGGRVLAFVAGYAGVWSLYGVLAWGVDALLRALAPDFLAWTAHGPKAAGLVVVAAGLCEALEVQRQGRDDLIVPMVSDAIRSIDLDAGQVDVDLRFIGEGADGAD